MTLGLGITLGAIFGLLLASAFFSGSETALTAASRAKMHALEEGGSRRARVVNYLLTIRERFIGASRRLTLQSFFMRAADAREHA